MAQLYSVDARAASVGKLHPRAPPARSTSEEDPMPLPVTHRPAAASRPGVAFGATAVLVALLVACAPSAAPTIAPPSLRFVPDGSGLTRLDVPDVAGTAAGATFRLLVDVVNPNPVALRVARLEGAFSLGGAALGEVAVDDLDLRPGGTTRLALDVVVPFEALPRALPALADLVLGRRVPYRLDGTVGFEVLGVAGRLGPVTLLEGSFGQEIVLRAPDVTWDRAASGVRSVSFDRVELDLALLVRNPNPVGLALRAPDVRLRVGGREVAVVQVVPGRVRALEETTLVLRVVLNPLPLGAAVVTQLQALAAGGAASVDVVLVGAWELELPGVRSVRLDPTELVRGRLD
jgi:hypothetical protein